MGTNWTATVCSGCDLQGETTPTWEEKRGLGGSLEQRSESMQAAQPSRGVQGPGGCQLQRLSWEVRAYLFEVQGTRSAAVRQCPLAFCYLWTSAIGFWNYSVHWLWQGNGSCKYTLVHSARSFTTKVTRINNSDLQCLVDTTTCFPTPAPLATSSPQGL